MTYSIRQTIGRIEVALYSRGKARTKPNIAEARAALDELERLLDGQQSVMDLELDGKTIDTLDKIGIETVEELRGIPYEELITLEGIKHGRATEILEALERL